MCIGDSPKAPKAPPPPAAPPPPPEPPILDQDPKQKGSNTEAQASQGIKSLRIDRTTSNVGAGGGSLNIPS